MNQIKKKNSDLNRINSNNKKKILIKKIEKSLNKLKSFFKKNKNGIKKKWTLK